MEEIYNYLKMAEKVYIVGRTKNVRWWHLIFNIAWFILWNDGYGVDNVHTCYLVKFSDRWEILVIKKGKLIELLKLKSKFQLENKFICGEYEYKLYHEITHDLYNYLKYSY